MFCSQCGTEIGKNDQICPSCGTSFHKSISGASATIPSSQSVKKKKMPLWFKILIGVAFLLLVGVTGGILFTETLVDVIDKQLEALRNNEISKAYYEYTSKEFQAATSLDQYRQFVETYPAFLNNHSAHFTQRAIKNNVSTLKGNLSTQNQIHTPVEYRLIKEDNKWKILSIRLLQSLSPYTEKTLSNAQDLINVVQNQLQLIQNNQLLKAYKEYSAEEFKETTSKNEFENFVKRYSILQNYQTTSYHKEKISDGIGTLTVILQTNHLAAYVKYYLVYEDNAWKVWSMRIQSPEENAQESRQHAKKNPKLLQTTKMSFGSYHLGSSVNKEGFINHPQTEFKEDLKDLYIDLEIANAAKNSVIQLNLQHLESGTSIPAKAIIEEEGDTLLMSVFTPPSAGWPKGHYRLIITTSSGLNKIIDFNVE
ncbi:DUF4864 domain-containing protein [Candidatus Protochlamydia amoebophila]|uniref:DUF4864 domain-containing protein n=1 Tax=Candidatus Protochlamydia amoebophila TaxID=362787 RepID=UPI001BCA6664|nr:DUF4864 domain-containing protein [Candidatus Protochlamydia amoebophila]